jgi:prepilin signal peptidase PulO-like enzyme (type II secretory pathway)
MPADTAIFVLKGICLAAILTWASIYDVKKREIPESVWIMVGLLGLIHFQPEQLFGLLWGLPFLLFALAVPADMGGGDVKFAAAIGFFLGFEGAMAAIFIGMLLPILYWLVRGRKKNCFLPLAPGLSIGAVFTYFIFCI